MIDGLQIEYNDAAHEVLKSEWFRLASRLILPGDDQIV